MERRRIDLEFWLDMYDWLDSDSEDQYQTIEWANQNFFYPPDNVKEEVRDAHRHMERNHELSQFVRKRILKYNR